MHTIRTKTRKYYVMNLSWVWKTNSYF
jgi:hypothetical protein